MAAEFKSHILRREEKGFFGVPLKRLLLAGVVGGLAYTLMQMLSRESSIPSGVLVAVVTLVLTGERGGLPLGIRLLYRLRGALLLAAAQHPGGIAAQLALHLHLPVALARLDSAQLFTSNERIPLDMREWVTFQGAAEDDGLVFVDAPMEEEQNG